MITHILVPVDFSEISEIAVKEAAAIAREVNGRLTLLHAYLIPGYSGGMAYETFIPPVDEHIDLINKQIDEFAEGIPELKNIEINKMAIPGAIQDMIGAYTEDNKIDLVVSATRGSSGFFGFLLGSQSERIEGEVKCPVLVLPEGSQLKKHLKIAFAHDYKSRVNENQREVIQFFLKYFNSEFNIVHVESKDDTPDAEESVKANLKDLNPTCHKVVNDDVEKGLNLFVEEHQIDMLILIYHDHGFLNRIFGKSTSRQLTHHTKIPLLVLK